MSDNSELVRIMPDVKGPKIDVFFVYPEELRNSKRVAVFRDFLLARLAEVTDCPDRTNTATLRVHRAADMAPFTPGRDSLPRVPTRGLCRDGRDTKCVDHCAHRMKDVLHFVI